MEIPYGTSAFTRSRGNFPALPVVNMIAEQAPVESGVSLQSRLGIENAGIEMGIGPVTALYQIDGVLNNGLFGISDNSLYSSGTFLGALDGTGPSKIAAYADRVFAHNGKTIFAYNGTTFVPVAFPDASDVTDICVGTSHLIGIHKDSGKFYWADALSSTIDALSFATAENSPDKLKACLFIGDTLLLFGSETVEIWPVSQGDINNPFAPLIGRTYQVGIRATGCASQFDTTFAWITNHNQICVGEPHSVVSDWSIEELLTKTTSAKLWNLFLEGIEYLALTTDTETWIFNSRTKTWSQFESYGEANFLPQCSAGGFFGSSKDGNILQWATNYSDFGDILERRFRAGVPVTSPGIRIDNITLRTNPGQTGFLEGDYADATIEMRTSRDGGFTWGPFKARTLGEQGKYRTLVTWRSLGIFGYPSFLSEFRVTDPVPFRVSGVEGNNQYGTI
jgi:hypothetical protein